MSTWRRTKTQRAIVIWPGKGKREKGRVLFRLAGSIAELTASFVALAITDLFTAEKLENKKKKAFIFLDYCSRGPQPENPRRTAPFGERPPWSEDNAFGQLHPRRDRVQPRGRGAMRSCCAGNTHLKQGKIK